MSSPNASSLVRTRPGAARRRITNTGANDVGREEEMGSLTAGTKRTQDRLSEIANGIGSGGVGSGNETARQKRKRMGEGVSESAVAGSQIGQMASSAMAGSLSSSSLVRSTSNSVQFDSAKGRVGNSWTCAYSRQMA